MGGPRRVQGDKLEHRCALGKTTVLQIDGTSVCERSITLPHSSWENRAETDMETLLESVSVFEDWSGLPVKLEK